MSRLPDASGSGGRSFWLRHLHALGIVTSLLLLVAFFWACLGESFVSASSLQLQAIHLVGIALPALGMTLVIISGGIDLGVGSVIALSMCVTAFCVEETGSLALAGLAGVATGALSGLVNGLLITSFRLVPFIVTLGMMSAGRGAAKVVAHRETIYLDLDGTWLKGMTLSGSLFFAPGVWILIGLSILGIFVLRCSVFGRQVFAVGSNEEAARLCGVPVERTKILIYTVAGVFTGMAGVYFCGRGSEGNPSEAVGHELDVIAAVVIGGGSLSGGEGSIIGSLAGAAIMVVLRTGLRMMNAGVELQEILIGAIIIIAVLADQLQHRKGV